MTVPRAQRKHGATRAFTPDFAGYSEWCVQTRDRHAFESGTVPDQRCTAPLNVARTA